MTKRRRWGLLIAVLAISLGLVACDMLGLGDSTQPTVIIRSPASGASVPVNTPVTVEALASDPEGAGVLRIDLQVDGVTVDVFEAGGPQAELGAQLSFTPTVEGAVSVAVIAFRENGASSPPATIALLVVGMTAEPPTGGDAVTTEAPPTDGTTPAPTTETPEVRLTVEARANLDTNIREAPGPGCPIIGVVPVGETITLLEVTDSPTEYWYKTDYLGPNTFGWVYHESFTLLGDDSILPRVRELGCLYCGDGVCSPEIDEACNNCEVDCGPCCGNGVCEPAFGEACNTCEVDCGPCCGNGTCEPGFGEACNTCEVDCGPCCGNGVCEGKFGENCNTCPKDCGNCCGDKVCDPVYGETCETCPKDCGVCVVCGDKVCDTAGGENCKTCPLDCGPC